MFSSTRGLLTKTTTAVTHFSEGAEKYQEVEYMKAIPNTYERKMAVFLQVWCFHVTLKNNGPLQLDY